MKLGTESKNKTIVAVVLLVLAVIFVARWLLTSDSGSVAASPVHAVQTPQSPQSDNNASPAKRQASRRSDQKYITPPAWKPSLDPSLNLKMLEEAENIKYAGTGRNPFAMTEERLPEIPKPADTGRTTIPNTPVNTGPPPPPPINRKFYGYSTKTGQKTVFLSQDKDTVFLAHEGDIIGRRYKIVRINPNSVDVMDLLTNNRQTINLTS